MNELAMTPENGLSRYLQRIRRFPMLEEAEERDLIRRWREERDASALRLLVGSHLRLVARMAMDNRGYGLPVGELISEGHVGLMQAIEKFDPEKGFRLSTYARWWIRAAMQDYILRNWSLVKTGTTAAQKKLFFNLRRLKHQLRDLEVGDLTAGTVRAIAEELAVPETAVVEMNRRLAGPDLSLNATVTTEDNTEWLDWLVSEEAGQEALLAASEERTQRRQMLGEAIRQLDPRERRILIERRLRDDPVTLERLSQHFNISRERVRQLEVRAFDKVRKAMHKAAASLPDAHLAAA